MEKDFIVYYDTGTSNTRIYLLDHDFQLKYTAKKNIGSKDCSISGSNLVLIQALKDLYDGMLNETGVPEEQIDSIYASGMATSPYGIKEVPHHPLPVSAEDLANSLYCFYEDRLLHKNIYLIRGLRTTGDEISSVNNVRGEETEIIGALDLLEKDFPNRKIALVLPGSHTHTALIENNEVKDLLSTMTGELFHAVKSSTILSAVLNVETKDLDKNMVSLGVKNLHTYGFNRAIYICHGMRLFNKESPEGRKSYAEGVLNGGYSTALAHCCEQKWKGCETAVIVSNKYMYDLYSTILADNPYIKQTFWYPITSEKNYTIMGLKKIISCIQKKG
jgi:2-dehydro-3-deoxygalactonokinase